MTRGRGIDLLDPERQTRFCWNRAKFGIHGGLGLRLVLGLGVGANSGARSAGIRGPDLHIYAVHLWGRVWRLGGDLAGRLCRATRQQCRNRELHGQRKRLIAAEIAN